MPRKHSSRHVPERFLRQIWKQQYFNADHLHTTDGRAISVLSAGILNTDGGPDFKNAVIRVGNVTYRGAVELHQNYDEWNGHCHHQDPKYNGVILHAVLYGNGSGESQATQSKRTIPVLILEKVLDASYRSLWEHMILNERAERLSTIPCCAVNDSAEASLIQQWLTKLGIERIELKVRKYEERLKELIDHGRLAVKEPPSRYDEIPFGLNPEDLPPPVNRYTQTDLRQRELWQQVIYEGMMEALGYSKNRDPFLTLARSLTMRLLNERISAVSIEEKHLHIESMLFGAAGLLPPSSTVSEKASKEKVKNLKRLWKQYRTLYRGEHLHEADWQFFRLRPENFPTVRLAGAARLIRILLERDFLTSIIQIVKDPDRESKHKCSDLIQLFLIPADGYWTQHYRFGERASNSIYTLIGKDRSRDIVLNVVIPLCLLYARLFKDKEVRSHTLDMLEQQTFVNDNSILKIIDKQLIKGKFKLDSALFQQGALQLYKFYCVEKRCGACAIGNSVY